MSTEEHTDEYEHDESVSDDALTGPEADDDSFEGFDEPKEPEEPAKPARKGKRAAQAPGRPPKAAQAPGKAKGQSRPKSSGKAPVKPPEAPKGKSGPRQSPKGKFSQANLVQIARVTAMVRSIDGEAQLRILLTLADYERRGQIQPVSNLVEDTGLSQPSVSHHLSLLRLGGIVDSVRNGKLHLYSLTDKGTRAVGLAERLSELGV